LYGSVRGAISNGRPYRDNYPDTGFAETSAVFDPTTLPPSRLRARHNFRIARDTGVSGNPNRNRKIGRTKFSGCEVANAVERRCCAATVLWISQILRCIFGSAQDGNNKNYRSCTPVLFSIRSQ
jgi:hypothetical protein